MDSQQSKLLNPIYIQMTITEDVQESEEDSDYEEEEKEQEEVMDLTEDDEHNSLTCKNCKLFMKRIHQIRDDDLRKNEHWPVFMFSGRRNTIREQEQEEKNVSSEDEDSQDEDTQEEQRTIRIASAVARAFVAAMNEE